MRYKKCTDPKVFGFGIFIPNKFYPYISKYKRLVKPHLEWFVEKKDNPKSNSMRPHITIKYLAYHKKYSNKQIFKLSNELKEISKKYLPLEINVKGIKIGILKNIGVVGVLLNYSPNNKIKQFHKEVIEKLGNKIDIFENMDGKNFSPHIALGSGKINSNNIRELKKIAKESKKDDELKIKITDAYIYLKNKGPTRIFRKSK